MTVTAIRKTPPDPEDRIKCLLIRYSLHKRTEHPRPRRCPGVIFHTRDSNSPWLTTAGFSLSRGTWTEYEPQTSEFIHRYNFTLELYKNHGGGLDKDYQEITFFWKEGEHGFCIRTSTVYGQSSFNRNKEDTARPQTGAKSSPAKIHTALNLAIPRRLPGVYL